MNPIVRKYCSKEWCEFLDFHSETRTYMADETIFKIGEDTLGLYIINKGKVKIITSSGGQNTRLIRLAADGDILGHRGFGGEWKYTISAITLEETEVFFIPLKIFNYTVKANPEFGFHMMMFFAQELRDSERLAKTLPIKSIVASVIYSNYQVFGFEEGHPTKLSYTLSRKDIASKAGTRYETVVRILAELNTEGIIKSEGKSIHIMDIPKLEILKEGE